FVAGATCAGVVESEDLAVEAIRFSPVRLVAAAATNGGTRDRSVSVEVEGRRFDVVVQVPEAPWAELARRRHARRDGLGGPGSEAVVSPMQGIVLKVEVAEGDSVEAGQVICVVEAMKMENEITARRDGVVAKLGVATGESVSTGQVICVVAAASG